MKLVLVFIIFSTFQCYPSTTGAAEINQPKQSPSSDTVLVKVDTLEHRSFSTRSVRGGMRENAKDHPVLQGDRATDAGASDAEHLAPLIFMVMAFLIAFIAGCLWWNKLVLHGPEQNPASSLRTFKKTLVTMVFVAATFAFIAGLLLLNIGVLFGLDHDHGQSDATVFDKIMHHHHLVEIILSFLAFSILLLSGIVVRKQAPFTNVTGWILGFLLGVIILLLALIIFVIVAKFFHLGHHDLSTWEIVLSVLLFLSLLALAGLILYACFSNILNSDKRLHVAIFVGALLELIVIVILLNIFPKTFYKLCNDSCVMLGSHAGLSFDQPCADNIAFMTYHHTQDTKVDDYLAAYYGDPTLPLFYEYASPIAMHEPIFPGVQINGPNITSDPINFTLDDDKNLIEACTLYIRSKQFLTSELQNPPVSLGPINATPGSWAARWKRNGLIFDKILPGGGTSPVDNIAHGHTVTGLDLRVTYVTYKFAITYRSYQNSDGVLIQTPPENIEITFVLQDYHERLGLFPAPVYVQGNMKDVLDVLFVPAIRQGSSDVIDPQFLTDFRKNSRSIIKDAIFQEPSLRFWRKQFNFWINKQEGYSADARCNECCHTEPANFLVGRMRYISKQIEFIALLHKGTQWDFTDHCNSIFSAEMELVNDNNERSSFLHEFGHGGYGLSDEYLGGHNHQAIDHLPNNWRTRWSAKNAAPLRHKTTEDVKKLSKQY